MVSVDVKQHWTDVIRAQELCESRGGRPGIPVHNSPYGFCGRKATLNLNPVVFLVSSQKLCSIPLAFLVLPQTLWYLSSIQGAHFHSRNIHVHHGLALSVSTGRWGWGERVGWGGVSVLASCVYTYNSVFTVYTRVLPVSTFLRYLGCCSIGVYDFATCWGLWSKQRMSIQCRVRNVRTCVDDVVWLTAIDADRWLNKGYPDNGFDGGAFCCFCFCCCCCHL